jgi:antitoxin VapB
MKTRAFKSGNSQAVRIPAEIAFSDMNVDLEIMRVGDIITIRPFERSLKDAVEMLRRMPKPETVELIERTESLDPLDDH